MPPRLIFSAFSLGFIALVSQVVLIREMVVACAGSEISMGMVLAAWLLWGAVGSLAGSRLARRTKAEGALAVLMALLCLALPASVALVRAMKGLFGILPGEIVGLAWILFASFAMTAPVCVLLGLLFVANAASLRASGAGAASASGGVYLWEAAGAAAGGAVATYLLLPRLDNFELAWIIMGLSAVTAAVILWGRMGRRAWLLLAALVVLAAAVRLTGLDRALEAASLSWRWSGLGLVENLDSRYGNIAAVRRFEQVGLYESGLLVFSYPDRASAEEAVHYALLQHPGPARLLLVGGGVAGALGEALKYPDLRVDYVELDPELIECARRHLDDEASAPLDSPRVEVFVTDGRLFVQSTDRHYDVVVIDLPDPLTAQINRFYTVGFFREVERLIGPGGLLAFRVTSAENYIGDELADFLSGLRRSLEEVFAQVVVLPGHSALFFASPRAGLLSADPQILVDRLLARGVRTQFVSEHQIPFRLTVDRIAYLEERLAQGNGEINTDLRPVCYFYNMLLRSTRFGSAERSVLGALKGLRGGWAAAAVALLFSPFLLAAARRRLRTQAALLGAIFAAGFSVIGMEIVMILAFQVFCGYVYSKIGMVMAAFMAGLAVGAWAARRLEAGRTAGPGRLAAVQAAMAGLALLGWVALVGFESGRAGTHGIEAFTLLFLFASGTLGGLQFIMANSLYLRLRAEAADRALGAGYGVDLLGSAFGAVLVSAVLIPISGIPMTLAIIAGLNVLAVALLALTLNR